MATSPDLVAASQQYRAAQAKQAAKVAALVRLYFLTRVNIFDPSSVEAWLQLVLPRILSGRDQSAEFGARYGNFIREAELPGVKDAIRFEKATTDGLDNKIRTSLAVVGPGNASRQFEKIDRLDLDQVTKQVMRQRVIETAAKEIQGATMRHTLDGGRESIDKGVKNDPKALGYVRVTKDDPCYFCAMLASRGITYGPYKGDSFDLSDARFIGEGDVKVHDHCSCTLVPTYREDDPHLQQSEAWRAMWDGMEHRSGPDAVKAFRQMYEGREVTAA